MYLYTANAMRDMTKLLLYDLSGFLKNPDDVQYNVSAIKKVKIFIILFLVKVFIFLLLIYPLLILLNNITDLHHRWGSSKIHFSH